jgi:hypothetical protein
MFLSSDHVTDGILTCDFVDDFCGMLQLNERADSVDWRVHQGESMSRASGADTGPTANTTCNIFNLFICVCVKISCVLVIFGMHAH